VASSPSPVTPVAAISPEQTILGFPILIFGLIVGGAGLGLIIIIVVLIVLSVVLSRRSSQKRRAREAVYAMVKMTIQFFFNTPFYSSNRKIIGFFSCSANSFVWNDSRKSHANERHPNELDETSSRRVLLTVVIEIENQNLPCIFINKSSV
jgi:hypothetical protein